MGAANTIGPDIDQGEAKAFTDPLTGLGNHHRLQERIRSLSAERAADPAPFTVALVNLDGFKPINDLFGSLAGMKFCARSHIVSKPVFPMAPLLPVTMATSLPWSCR